MRSKSWAVPGLHVMPQAITPILHRCGRLPSIRRGEAEPDAELSDESDSEPEDHDAQNRVLVTTALQCSSRFSERQLIRNV